MINKRIVVGGGGETDGVFIYFADGSNDFYSRIDIFGGGIGGSEEYDPKEYFNWSLVFSVENRAASQENVVTDATTDLYQPTNTTAADYSQTKAIIPLVRRGSDVSSMGVYVEEISCVNGLPIVQFYKVG